MAKAEKIADSSQKQQDSTEQISEHSSTGLLRNHTASPFSLDSRNLSEMDHLPPTAVSSSESVRCRVCMCGVADLDEPLLRLGCACKGTLEYAHEQCIHQWVRIQSSATCEVCKSRFDPSVVPPVGIRIEGLSRVNSSSSEDLWQRIERIREQRSHRTWARTNRLWFAVLTVLLMFATSSSGSLTAHAHRNLVEYKIKYHNGTEPFEGPHDVTRRFYVSLFFLFFSLAATCFIVLLWAFFEIYLWPREHRRRDNDDMPLTTVRRTGSPAAPRRRVNPAMTAVTAVVELRERQAQRRALTAEQAVESRERQAHIRAVIEEQVVEESRRRQANTRAVPVEQVVESRERQANTRAVPVEQVVESRECQANTRVIPVDQTIVT